MDQLQFPTREGALEVARHLDVDPNTIDFTCQDWQYTNPRLEQLPGFISAYRSNRLSDAGKRVLGCFIFQSLDDYLGDGGSESLVRETLQLLAADYHIHETEFRYWAHIDVDDQDQGESNDGFHITPYVNAFIL